MFFRSRFDLLVKVSFQLFLRLNLPFYLVCFTGIAIKAIFFIFKISIVSVGVEAIF